MKQTLTLLKVLLKDGLINGNFRPKNLKIVY